MPSGSEENDFLMTSLHFCIFEIISPLKRTWPFILNNLEFPSPKDDLYQYLILVCGSGEEDF
jgi:hypothetical protein